MRYEFHVTKLGLVLNDGRMAMPGSVIVLTALAPSHWASFGETKSKPTEAGRLEVATPAVEPERDDELEELRALYEQETGSQPDGRWGVRKIKQELGI